ncbi:MAG: PEPxxWA-CTERM sorting domain-containing protein [Chakrabartia sp.]
MKKSILTVFGVAASLFLATAAQASDFIADNFTRTSPVENIIAPFTAPNGTTSTGSYTGFVEVLVSGTGYSLGSVINDAFYIGTASQGGSYYHLGLGVNGQPLAPFQPTLGAERLISFIDGVGAVPFGTVPAYNPDHVYRFVLNLGAPTTPLTFGVLDGNFHDNGGQYNISLWQLRAGAVPEPETWALMLIGFGAVGIAARRRTAAGRALKTA